MEIPKRNSKNANWIGIDVGGANIKIADLNGKRDSVAFPMWTDYRSLTKTLDGLVREFSGSDVGRLNVAATMTGELADCFASKREGVRYICQCLQQVTVGAVPVETTSNDSRCVIYRISDSGGKFVSPCEAAETWKTVAAANWHALASWVAKASDGESGVLFDIGSTTTDIIPFSSRQCVSDSVTDIERIRSGELVYTGVVRSPVCALVQEFEYAGRRYPLAQEFFATVLDAYLVLGLLPESESNRFTADGRPSTISCAKQRLARCLCADSIELDDEMLVQLARRIVKVQQALIEKQFERVCDSLCSSQDGSLSVVVSGEGSWLGQQIAGRRTGLSVTSLAQMFDGKADNTSATAFAVAKLAQIAHAHDADFGATHARC